MQGEEQLKLDSNMLKHALANHEGEDLVQLKFGIRTIQYARLNFERQILESCKNKEERQNMRFDILVQSLIGAQFLG